MMKRIGALVVAATMTCPQAAAAPPAGACHNPTPARPPITDLPWAQRTLMPKTVWPHSKGAGVLVAVVDSGVDSDHPQLRAQGKVLAGQDFYLVGDLPGNFDCVSHGTGVASIIAADPVDGTGFAGLAPDAKILPVRVTDRDVTEQGAPSALDPVVLARGIWYAADHGAKVINLSVAGSTDNQYVRDAIAHAQSKDALVIAAAGNTQDGENPGPATFPAGYDGVLGVGAVDPAGMRMPASRIGAQVDVVAPGVGVTTATRAGGHHYQNGTSFAAAFVSATAALVRSAWPGLNAREVANRIMATASPAPGGEGAAYGAGLVNPYRAVTEGLSPASPLTLPDVEVPPADPEQVREAAWWTRTTWHTRLTAGTVIGVAALVLLLALVLRRGRREGWRPRRADAVSAEPAWDELPDEDSLFTRG
ncbi:type VII secretion-associated serine protease mycosin [Lentzea sp. PSKA42]|uniref:Type VII secretion-associated serine protease mycosin n=1 Tax=Lentzea indica TaxID=2604800 RepID=A0ABX1FVM9_9PSEU|nr:type VII secretion-associated serine protease mycosin [Lentzea indica]NKE62488.1 type VII secretion-associated serine protease mycosin [Lentzea indica]